MYGYPISATHSIIGGLVAAGLAWDPDSIQGSGLGKTCLAWVLSPLAGGITAALTYSAIHIFVLSSPDPARHSYSLQPVFVAVGVGMCAAFLLIKGPEPMRIEPVSLAAGVSVIIGVGAAGMTYVYRGFKARGNRRVAPAPTTGAGSSKPSLAQLEAAEQYFIPLLIMSALTVAFAHGGNDVGNAAGPLSAIIDVHGNPDSISASPSILFWTLVMNACAFALGIWALGSRTVSTVGSKITQLTPSKAFATQMGAALAVLLSSVFGMPVSTSHCLVGAVVGIGLAQRMFGVHAQLDFSVLRKIIVGWVVTIPLAMLVTVIVYYIMVSSYS